MHCPRFGVCKTYSAHDARCECFDQCPSYQDPVCTANGTTYDNKCWHELSYCRGLENNLVYHPGSCEGKGTIQYSLQERVNGLYCSSVKYPHFLSGTYLTIIDYRLNTRQKFSTRVLNSSKD